MIDMTFFDKMKGEARAKRKEGFTNQDLLDVMETHIDEALIYIDHLDATTNRDNYEVRNELRTNRTNLMECMNLIDILRHRKV